MIYLKTSMMNYVMGNKIFHSSASNRFVLCRKEHEAVAILSYVGLPAGTIKQCARLDETSVVKHMCGQRVTIYHRGKKYECDTRLAAGVPRGVDTTRPVNFGYVRCNDDTP